MCQLSCSTASRLTSRHKLLDGASISLYLTPAHPTSDRDRIAYLYEVDANENLTKLFHGSPFCSEDRAGLPKQSSKMQCRTIPPKHEDIRIYSIIAWEMAQSTGTKLDKL